MDSIYALYREHLNTVHCLWDRELARCGYDAAVIFSGSPQPILFDDKYYPFKINPHFQQIIPLLQPIHSALVLRVGEKPCLWFFDPVDHWESSENIVADYWASHLEIVKFGDKSELQTLTSLLPHGTTWIGDRPAFAMPDHWSLNPADLLNAVAYARAIKTAYEQQQLRGAASRAVKGHKAAEKAFRKGGSEFEIHMDYLAASQHTENELPYQSIICLNEHAACLHYRNKVRQRVDSVQRRSLLIDAGALHNGYIADVTRTYAQAPGIFADLVDAVDRMQLSIIDTVRPGIDYVDLNYKAHISLAHILNDMQLVDMEPEDMVVSGVSGTFFPHGLGHFIGVQVHDVGGHFASPQGDLRMPPKEFPYLRLTRVLEAGHALTIEPGLYFIPSLLQGLRERLESRFINWPNIEKLVPYGGVRIEDNIIVADEGVENMTRLAFAA